MGRPKGTRMSEESKQATRESMLAYHAAVRELIKRAAAEGTLPEVLRSDEELEDAV